MYDTTALDILTNAAADANVENKSAIDYDPGYAVLTMVLDKGVITATLDRSDQGWKVQMIYDPHGKIGKTIVSETGLNREDAALALSTALRTWDAATMFL